MWLRFSAKSTEPLAQFLPDKRAPIAKSRKRSASPMRLERSARLWPRTLSRSSFPAIAWRLPAASLADFLRTVDARPNRSSWPWKALPSLSTFFLDPFPRRGKDMLPAPAERGFLLGLVLARTLSAGSCFIDRPYRAASRQASGSGLPGLGLATEKLYTKDLRLQSPFSRTEPYGAFGKLFLLFCEREACLTRVRNTRIDSARV